MFAIRVNARIGAIKLCGAKALKKKSIFFPMQGNKAIPILQSPKKKKESVLPSGKIQEKKYNQTSYDH
jgi:hypothetical protein